MSYPITARLYQAGFALEEPRPGKIWADPKLRRFGFELEAGAISWYPMVSADGKQYSLDVGQSLGGLASDGAPNSVVLDFRTPNELQVRDRITGDVYARFARAGSQFTSATVQGTTRLGIVNQVLNAGLLMRRGWGIPDVPRVSSDGTNSVLIAPNWELWNAPQRSGLLDLRFSDDVPFSSCGKAAEVQVLVQPVHAGLRVFLHSALHLADRNLNFSAFVKGPAGAFAQQRALSGSGLLGSISLTGSGEYKRESFTVKMPGRSVLQNADYLVYDLLYNPGQGPTGTAPANQKWLVAAPQISLGTNPVDWDARSLEMEKGLCSGIYSEQRHRLKRGESRELVYDLLPGYTNVAYFNSGSTPVIISDKQANGALLSLDVTGASDLTQTVQVAAYRLPYLEESLGN